MGNINGHETRITAPWLRMRLAEPETAGRICLIDATPKTGEPCIPYSRALDVRELTNGGSALPSAQAFQSAVRLIGATSLDQVVIYDRDDPAASSVLWHLFRAFGHLDTCFLEGGYAAWRRASGELASRYSEQEPGTWRAQESRNAREAAAEILRLIGTSRMS
ncbi:MAG: thiosulfate/3-mercaptopyruvate sulfurtransferase [Alphaproteobacteria bacterium]|nr:thiosulfate/3-mercaptopyruvate sulfurtransferase [Alphaproteobacteria bacterium]MEA3027315.1 thiosulfate/3-mercaptopyruvate sulfurtransferase [Alphaproteobacteria bacterium]